jgi:hypothetical protein
VGHLGSLEANNSDHSLVDIHRFWWEAPIQGTYKQADRSAHTRILTWAGRQKTALHYPSKNLLYRTQNPRSHCPVIASCFNLLLPTKSANQAKK